MRGYLGCYGETIGVLDDDGGYLTLRPGAPARNASYLALSGDGTMLYAVEEDPAGGRVGAFAVGGAALRPLGSQPTDGTSPCHLSLHPSGRYVLSANYGSGSVAVHPLGADGAIGERTDLVQHAGGGPDSDRQDGPHAHMIVTEPSGAYVLAVDLGTDSVYRYRLDLDTGRLDLATTVALRAGTGPRHLAFHPGGGHAYVVGELDSMVTVLELASFHPGGAVSTLQGGASAGAANLPSAIKVSADGRFCYVANRGHDSIAVFAVHDDGEWLELTATVPCGGEHPRDLALARGRLYVANQFSGTVTCFAVDARSGRPRPDGEPLRTPSPACLVVMERP